jgi:cytochrome c-type protein NapC
MTNNNQSKGGLKGLWQWLWTPGTHKAGTLVVLAGLGGVILWGGFNWSLELTNTEEFCISCHEMRENVFVEYQDTIHYSNRSGVRATCPDCHVPREWAYKMVRKIKATNELWHKMMGSISTREKFEEKRLELAINEWKRMKKTDSHECRNCHNYDSMDFSEQGRRSSRLHEKGFAEGKTCIDCHKGVAHELPEMDEDHINEELAKLVKN